MFAADGTTERWDTHRGVTGGNGGCAGGVGTDPALSFSLAAFT